jgi:hypothetical protein
MKIGMITDSLGSDSVALNIFLSGKTHPGWCSPPNTRSRLHLWSGSKPGAASSEKRVSESYSSFP